MTSIFRVERVACILLGFFDPEYGSDMFLRKIG
jgi:hypothetical protein